MNSKRPWIFAALGAVAATAATLVAVTVLTDDDPEPTVRPGGLTERLASARRASDEPTDEPTTSRPTSRPRPTSRRPARPPRCPSTTSGDAPAGTRLFREFHRLEKETVDAAPGPRSP